ncbi:uncharacterized protein [Drosophila virilis]|uniref:Chitin-binding type-2 domain-containing protein n=1 Tax=Drosophila virilis TaxID=7244 RepID=B4LVA9_DROVI|nr:uncharacterized protein LOC6628205 [Drosophila virilis]EDW64369.1 uncharacterized protein Dvir_GJ17435 [Drosophila virilis]
MHGSLIYVCLLISLFYFSEGKPCPEKSRRHKTRCDAYYKCRDLPSNSHVWIPTKCNEGLVYEHNVGSCVLPGEDWECITPGELESTSNSLPGKDADIIIVNTEDESGLLLKESSHLQDDDKSVDIVLDATISSEESEDKKSPALPAQQASEYESSSSSQFDSSGDGELVDLDGQLQAATREGEVKIGHNSSQSAPMAMFMEPSSTNSGEHMTFNSQSGSPIDPNLTAHLQRLSQLIDGLQQKYQKTDKPQLEMRPDQLNAFLAHFDLKNHFDMINPLGSHMETTAPTTTTKPALASANAEQPVPLPRPTVNKTLLQEHLTKHRMQPETKLILSSAQPFSSHGQGYANSQIVVNRPEGSVTFTLPQYGHGSEQAQQNSLAQSHEYNDHEPKVSEETLKTVLELSKQMIAAQNLPKVLPNTAYNGAFYAPPILQPVILTPHGNPFQQYYPMQNYESQPPPPPPRNHYVHHKKASGYNKKQPSTTIIHNNVIPVHVSSTSSGEKEVLDTYGNSLGVYPSLNNNHKNNQMDDSNSSNNYYNKFMTTMTTARPSSGMSVTTMSSQYSGQYAAPYASEFAQTTPRPFEEQPSAATVASYYTPSPHLDENNAHRVFHAESYPTSMDIGMNMPRPMDGHSPYPMHIDPDRVKIRPNSHKIESMEVEADDAINANYVNSNANNNQKNNNRHVLTYSSAGSTDTGMLGMSHQLAPGSYVEQNYAMPQNVANAQQQQHDYQAPYMAGMSNSVYSDAVGSNMYSTGGGVGMGAGNSIQMMPGKTKYPSGLGQLVNFNGNFISLDVFQKSILPLITQSPSALTELGKVEVITCQAGVRQPNQTDCTRYFVCSKKDGKVLTYSCPPYTGFNKQTRICDAATYAQCGNMPIFNGYSIEENRRQQMEALKMLAEAKRRQEATLKSQSIANILKQYGSMQEPAAPAISSGIDQSLLDSYMVSLPEPSSTPRPTPAIATLPPISNSSGSVKKRKYYCREGDKIPDQTSISSYFVCYKTAQGQMKGHKMTCSKGLLFCPRTLMCTLASKCSG